MRRGSPPGWIGAAGGTCDTGEAVLQYLLGRELERFDALSQTLNVRIGIRPELSSQPS